MRRADDDDDDDDVIVENVDREKYREGGGERVKGKAGMGFNMNLTCIIADIIQLKSYGFRSLLALSSRPESGTYPGPNLRDPFHF